MKAKQKPKTALIRIQGHTTLARSKPTKKATAKKAQNKRGAVKMGRGTHTTRHSEEITELRRKLRELKKECNELRIERGMA